MVRKAVLRMYTPEGDIVPVPVTSEEHAARLIAAGWKPAEPYVDVKKRNYPVLRTVGFRGSVRFFGHRGRF